MKLIIALIVLLAAVNTTHGQSALPSPEWRFETFGDYFYKVNGDSLSQDLQYSGQPRDFQAFQIRRALLGVTFPFAKDFAVAASIEHNDRINLVGGQFGLFLKTAFLQWKNVLPKSTLQLGLMPTPTWLANQSERVWGFRGVEKTISDMRNLGVATDLGVALRGNAGEGNELGYMVMFANGASIRQEADKYKKYYLVANYRFIENLVLEGYFDYEDRSSIQYKRTLKGILAWDSKLFTVGVEAVDQLDHCNCPPNLEKNRLGISAFARAPIMEEPGLVAFARFDTWDPDTKTDNAGFTENFITAGLDFKPMSTIHLIPNVWVNTYSSKQAGIDAPDPLVVARLTFWYVYN